MVRSDFIKSHDTLSVKVYDGTLCGNALHYNVKDIVSVNNSLVKDTDLLFEHIINLVIKQGINAPSTL